MKKAIYLLALAALLIAAGRVALDRSRAGVRFALSSHHAVLIRDGYNNTWTTNYGPPKRSRGSSREFLVPAGTDRPLVIDIFHRSVLGSARVEITGESGQPAYAFHGRKIDGRVADLPPGKYRLVVDLGGAGYGALEIGMKGAAVEIPVLDPKIYSRVDPAPGGGFRWAYFLYVPHRLAPNPVLLVEPNNTGFVVDDQRIHEAAAGNTILRTSVLADSLGVPLLVPTFPRPAAEENIYTHALDRDVLTCGREDIGWLDLQLTSMIDDARTRLGARGISLDSRVFLYGFSASGMFVDRYTLLHPDRVAAVACGSPGGWPMVPVAEYQGRPLRYPIGLADYRALTGADPDLAGMRRVPMFLFLGADDVNDSLVYRDGYEVEDERLIISLFGTTLPERWKVAEDLYKSAGLSARFVLYPGVGHDVPPNIMGDVRDFFARQLESRQPG